MPCAPPKATAQLWPNLLHHLHLHPCLRKRLKRCKCNKIKYHIRISKKIYFFFQMNTVGFTIHPTWWYLKPAEIWWLLCVLYTVVQRLQMPTRGEGQWKLTFYCAEKKATLATGRKFWQEQFLWKGRTGRGHPFCFACTPQNTPTQGFPPTPHGCSPHPQYK